MKTKCIFLVFGNDINKDFSNVKTIETKIIPNVGEEIMIKDGLFKVKRKVISYKHVEGYELKDVNRGGEMVYIFV